MKIKLDTYVPHYYTKFFVECKGKPYTCYLYTHQPNYVVTGYTTKDSTDHEEVTTLLATKIILACQDKYFKSVFHSSN